VISNCNRFSVTITFVTLEKESIVLQRIEIRFQHASDVASKSVSRSNCVANQVSSAFPHLEIQQSARSTTSIPPLLTLQSSHLPHHGRPQPRSLQSRSPPSPPFPPPPTNQPHRHLTQKISSACTSCSPSPGCTISAQTSTRASRSLISGPRRKRHIRFRLRGRNCGRSWGG